MAKRVVLYEPPTKINTHTDRDVYQSLFFHKYEGDVTEKLTTYPKTGYVRVRILGNITFAK